MLRYAITYGAIGGLIVIAAISAVMLISGPEGAGSSQAAGYAFMLAGLSLIFVGVKRYRDVERGGVITFGQGFLVGLSMAVVAGIFYTIGWEGVLRATDFAFIDTYGDTLINSIRAEGLAAAEEAARIAEVEEAMEMYRNLFFRLAITFVEIFPVGLLVALISAAVLRNPNVLPARANG